MTKQGQLKVGELKVVVQYGDVKHLHLSVHPPAGEVRVSVPECSSEDKVRRFVLSRIAWIRRQRRELDAQPRSTPRDYVSGETFHVWGKAYRLRVVRTASAHRVDLAGEWLELHVRAGTEWAGRHRLLRSFYRKELERALPAIRKHWEKLTGLRAAEYRIRHMRTKWGSCTVGARRIWLNEELAKHAPACLSYVVLHELLHLQEKGHTTAFRALLTQYLPGWAGIRVELNEGLVGVPALER